MTNKLQQNAARQFADEWKNRGYEKGESQAFWLSLLRDVLGVKQPEKIIRFEEQVHLDNTSFIDGYIESTHVLIEQKGIHKDLRQPIRQSDGKMLTPFQQAKRYSSELPYSLRPRWVVTCNFQSFLVYDMEKPADEPEEILLEKLPEEYYRLQFLVDTMAGHVKREKEVSLQAGVIVGRLYDALLKQYIHPDAPESLRSLNVLCVRLVFCLYAEDAGIFGRRAMFHDYLVQFAPERMREALISLFRVLDTPYEQRDPYLEDDLAAFPYVNGGLFAEGDIEIPRFNAEIAELLLQHASDDFDWSYISPTIFGALFESTINPLTRRDGGMHYTSIENIHKVIDPLFLDALRDELRQIKALKTDKRRNQQLKAFQQELASLHFLDPACGSGNFLTETYLSLRRLENECLRLLQADGQIALGGDFSPIQVSIGQFYGIEINDFAVSVARTALWIAEAQMMTETESIVGRDLDYLPLKSYPNIVEGNALRLDWETVCPHGQMHYIMGNPPFVGARMMKQGSEQKQEIQDLFGKIKDVQDLDYVCGWYKKAAEYIQGTKIEVAFVSTNSISQGSQVPILWGVLHHDWHIRLNFACQTFKWNSEANEKAAVHCVIIGFATFDRTKKTLYDTQGRKNEADAINFYLMPGANVLITARNQPLCDVPKMSFGNQPRDGGHFVIGPEERAELLKSSPDMEHWLRPYMGAEEFINAKQRWCLWLKDATPASLKQHKVIYDKVAAVRDFRLASSAKTTRGYAKVPHLFAQITQPDGVDYLLIPCVSSERRRYVPIGFMNAGTIASNAVQIIPRATLYHFGILTSSTHMAWMRTVCGRLETRYRYSKEIVYNNFPWPTPTPAQMQQIERTSQAILDARALYPDSSLADLYDDTTMPQELRQAHLANDRAVMKAYGFAPTSAEEEIVTKLFALYESLAKQA